MNEREIQTEDLMRGNAFMFHNYIEMESAERDKAVFKLVIRPESKNPYGIVHGGAIYTMADNAAGAVAHSDGRYYVTQTSSLHFLRNQAEGVVRAEARIRHRGKSTCLVDVDITGEGNILLATGQFTYFCVDVNLMAEKGKKKQ